MLKTKMIEFNFFRFIQSGFYIDFIFKKISEYVLRNVLIYSSNFFGEKFIIEFLTKKITDKFIYNYSKISIISFTESKYFIQIMYMVTIFITISVLILIYL